jgi:hypothetical protein
MDDHTITLKAVSMLRAGDKLVVVVLPCGGKHVIVDQRPFQWAMRWLTGDGRAEVLAALREVVGAVSAAVDGSSSTTPRAKTELLLLLPAFRAGLDRLKTTYVADCVTVLTLENLCASVDAILREHVFRSRSTCAA